MTTGARDAVVYRQIGVIEKNPSKCRDIVVYRLANGSVVFGNIARNGLIGVVVGA